MACTRNSENSYNGIGENCGGFKHGVWIRQIDTINFIAMQKTKPTCRTRNVIPSLALVIALSLSACSSKVTFPNSSVVPAANGWAQVKSTDTNYAVKIRIANLAPPERLSPPQNNYIVWVDTEANGIRRLGSIQSSRGFLSKAYKASLDATIPYKPTRIIITAESESDPLYPGMTTVLHTDVRVR